jgi:ribosomal protein S18 acetylase RimI-like enzyme
MLQKVMSTMNNDSNSMTSKVYLINGQPIGFINYYVSQPWILANNLTVKSNAHINFLAIDDKHHRKGAGTALLNDALDDLDKRSIHTVTLLTNDWGLESYYYRHGFYIVGSSRYTGCTKFMKRLQPHPAKLISSAIYERFFKNKE